MPRLFQTLALGSLLLLLTGCESGSDSTFTFSSTDSSTKDNDPVLYSAPTRANNSGCLSAGALATPTANDPLLAEQWHLKNTGQKAFSHCAGIADNSINLPETVWAETTGAGINVAVLDTDIDYAHPDLSANLDTLNSVDFSTTNNTGDHATSVAGIIAAEKDNGRGGAGVAPEATLQGFNILNSDNSYTNWNKALGKTGEPSARVDIFNQSFGYGKVANIADYDTTIASFYQDGVETLRSGKGALYFKSAGNYYSEYGACVSLSTNDYGLPCQNANMDVDNNIPYNIVVAAVNAAGKAASYSSSGSSVLFSAPGGEFGVNYPAIITTDDLDNNTSVNGQTGYTHKFNGTSSAAPMASGVAALILQANPSLGWRDVRHIMLTTADKIDSAINPATLDLGSGGTVTAEPTWQNNGAGHHYHNWYGFGRINAQAAVAAAKNYTGNLPAQQRKSQGPASLEASIPDKSSTGISTVFSVLEADKITVESVQVSVNLSHSYLSDLQIQLTSPSGMKSVLMTPLNGMNSSVSGQDIVLLSQAFYGENSLGNWTLQVIDINNGDTGTLHSGSMTIYGH